MGPGLQVTGYGCDQRAEMQWAGRRGREPANVWLTGSDRPGRGTGARRARDAPGLRGTAWRPGAPRGASGRSLRRSRRRSRTSPHRYGRGPSRSCAAACVRGHGCAARGRIRTLAWRDHSDRGSWLVVSWVLLPWIYPAVDLIFLGGWFKNRSENRQLMKMAKQQKFLLENRKLEAEVKKLEKAGEF